MPSNRKGYRQKYHQEHKEKENAYSRSYYQEHKEKWGIYPRAGASEEFLGIKGEVLTYYGNGELACLQCSFSDVRALSIDHIDNDGSEDKKKHGKNGGNYFYLWLKRHGYPEGYQTLCMNCQFIKEIGRRKNKSLVEERV